MKQFKKIIFSLLVLILIFISSGCKSTITFTIDYETDQYHVGDETFVSISSSSNIEVTWESSDPSVAIVDEYGVVYFKKAGTVSIVAKEINNPNNSSSVTFIVSDSFVTNIVVQESYSGNIGDTIKVKYQVEPRECKSLLKWESDNTDVCEVLEDGTINLLGEGISTITITALDEGNFSKSFKVGVFDYSKIIVDSLNEYELGQEVEYEGKFYYAGFNYLKSLKVACNNVNENGEIYVLKGTYSESFSINKNGIKIYGINYKDFTFEDSESNDSLITKSIIVGTNAKDVEIKGLTFINDAKLMLYGNNENILISNNKFLNISDDDEEWFSYKGDACIMFVKDDFESNNIHINNNFFKNISTHGIAFTYYKNLKITNNVFEDFNKDAIREYSGESLSNGQLLIRNNKFLNGKANAIFFNAYGSKAKTYEKIISIYDNEFNNVANDFDDIEHYAIKLTNFNGGTVSLSIKYNSFISCMNSINISENKRNDLDVNLHAYANYNIFKSNNINYIVNNKSSSLMNIDYNTYIDSDEKELNNVVNYIYGSTNPESNRLNLDQLNKVVKIYGKNNLNVNSETTFIIEDREVTWVSSNQFFASIDNEGNAKGTNVGTSIFRAMEDGKVIAEITVTVGEELNIDYASLLVQIALGEEGYVEGNNNYTKYGVWYGEKHGKEFENGAWCAMFVSWCANQANISTTIIPEYASCAAGKQFFISNGNFKYKEDYVPTTGDIIFFTSNGASHTGIVVKSENGKVYTIEGNTSNKCAQRSYNLDYYTITGYGVPEYPIFTGEKIDFDISSSTDGAGEDTH